VSGVVGRALGAVVPVRVRAVLARLLLRLPEAVQRRLAGAPVRMDGQQLATEVQLILRLSGDPGRESSVAASRRRLRMVTRVAGGRRIEQVLTSELAIASQAGTIRARLYRPAGLRADASRAGSPEPDSLQADIPAAGNPATDGLGAPRRAPLPLLVYYHGGGWVQGDLDTHDNVCRFLARHAGTAVLAPAYRLAPEHPFPAAVNDALAAYRYAARHAEELGADPAALAVGGDSAGGNLAVVVARLAAGDPRPPVFQLLLYPGTDAVEVSPSRRLFGAGFQLTEERIQWFLDQYLPDRADRADPRASPAYEPRPQLLPPTFLATAGFDPLRDEGEQLGARLAAAGVPVAVRRFDDLCHGFANAVGIGRRGREAMLEIAGALRAGLALGAAANRAPRRAPAGPLPEQPPDVLGVQARAEDVAVVHDAGE
jgi:acetyl esterase